MYIEQPWIKIQKFKKEATRLLYFTYEINRLLNHSVSFK